jgi:hypothetical protein
MKKITMLIAFLVAFASESYAQFPESFEGATFPPTGWTSFSGANGAGTDESWQQVDFYANTGDFSAYVSYENIDPDATAEDWLVTPLVAITEANSNLSFYQAQDFTTAYNSIYTVRVSTTSQTNIASFTTLSTQSESQAPVDFAPMNVDLSAYIGQSVYVAFVMSNDDGDSWYIDDVSFGTAVPVPDCASVPITPLDAATNIPVGAVSFSWTAPTTGGTPTGYDLFYGLTPGTVTTLIGTFPSSPQVINVTGYSTTFYWKVVPKNTGGSAVGCPVWSFTTQAPPGYCLIGTPYPSTTYVPETCDGVVVNEIVDNAYAGEYSNVTVTNGQPYTFISSVSTDFITISNAAGNTSLAAGVTPLTWTSNLDGNIRFYIHTSDQCGTEAENRVRSIICGTPTADLPDYVGLQWPPTMTFPEGGSGVVYGRVYEPLVTPGAGAGAGITAWVGVNDANTNPNTWSEASWVPATFNVDAGNDDEYMGTIGDGLAPGAYYYAVRFRLNAGAYVYGGINGVPNPPQGNFWDGTTHNSGVLTVTDAPPPANDECAGAIALTPAGDFASGAITTTNLGATDDGLGTSCQENAGFDVWYSVAVPASGTLTIETGEVDGSGFTDSVVVVYTGTCGSLTELECGDDFEDFSSLFSQLNLTGLTPGAVLYIKVARFTLGDGTSDDFQLSAYDASLGNPTFANNNFKVYPNPVKNILNLSSAENISDVAVYNLLGQQVVAKSVNATQSQIDMAALPKGTYMVKVTANNQVKTIKVIKE